MRFPNVPVALFVFTLAGSDGINTLWADVADKMIYPPNAKGDPHKVERQK